MQSEKDKIKVTRLFNKIKAAYKEDANDFNNEYHVYMELLFDLLYKSKIIDSQWDLRYSIFTNVVKHFIQRTEDFDPTLFVQELTSRYKNRRVKKYEIYFGARLRNGLSAQFPSKFSFKIEDVLFRRVTFRTVNNLGGGHYIKQLSLDYEKLRAQRPAINSMLFNDMVFFKATVHSEDENVAVNRVSSAFDIFTSCLTVAQEKSRYLNHWMEAQIKARKPLNNPYMFYVSGKKPFLSIYIAHDVYRKDIPGVSLEVFANPEFYKRYKKYKRILSSRTLSPIDSRIKEVIAEFDTAMATRDHHLRLLNLWRCLEIATKGADGNSRKQPEIIKIIGQYNKNKEWWTLQGELIMKLRNHYVHQGTSLHSQTRDNYLNWLHSYASVALTLLIWMRDNGIGKKSVTEIDHFFDTYQQSDEARKISRIVANAMKNSH